MEITLNFVLIVAHARYAECDPIVAPRVATDCIPESVLGTNRFLVSHPRSCERKLR